MQERKRRLREPEKYDTRVFGDPIAAPRFVIFFLKVE
jgi:hypothetical protein